MSKPISDWLRTALCRLGHHKWKMFEGGYQDIRCTRCGIWWDEQP